MNNLHKCVVCNQSPSDRAHLVSRATLPKKEKWNQKHWIYLCRKHHTEQHKIGIITFCNRYGLLQRLRQSGFSEWRIDEWLEKQIPSVR